MRWPWAIKNCKITSLAFGISFCSSVVVVMSYEAKNLNYTESEVRLFQQAGTWITPAGFKSRFWLHYIFDVNFTVNFMVFQDTISKSGMCIQWRIMFSIHIKIQMLDLIFFTRDLKMAIWEVFCMTVFYID